MSLFKEYRKAKKVSKYSRQKLLELQKQRFKETLIFSYNNSPFYKRLWESAGINKDNLLSSPIEKFPIVNKKIIMDSLQDVFTQQGIVKSDLERFIEQDQEGKSLFQNKYIILNTSGSSGLSGIFLFDQEFWNNLVATLTARLIPISIFRFLFRKTKIVFLGETSGHHSGISIVRSAPDFFIPLSLSISTPKEALIEALNKFKPHVLTGYSSALSSLAQEKLLGKLKISPEIIISSGEPLTSLRQKNIQNAFKIPVFDFYGATECLAIGVDNTGSGTLNIFDDIILLETLDENNNPVPQGQLGRIVITVLGNKIQPLVRYALDDEIIIKPNSPKSPFTQAERVLGRNMENLIFTIEGRKIELPPMELVGFFLQGLKQYQIIQTSENSLKVKIVAGSNTEEIKQKANDLIIEMLKENSLPDNSIKLELEFVFEIPPNPKTGKTPIVIPLQKYQEEQQAQQIFKQVDIKLLQFNPQITQTTKKITRKKIKIKKAKINKKIKRVIKKSIKKRPKIRHHPNNKQKNKKNRGSKKKKR